MSTLREVAEAVAKQLGEEVDYFLVMRGKEEDPQTGRRRGMATTNVEKLDDIREMSVKGVTAVAVKRARRAYGRN